MVLTIVIGHRERYSKMASTKVGDKDESISGDDASPVTPFHGPDRGSEYDHILTEILDNKAIKDSKIKNLWCPFDVCKDPNKINALKWKDPNNKIAKPLQISNDNGSALRMKFSVMTVFIKKLGIKSKSLNICWAWSIWEAII